MSQEVIEGIGTIHGGEYDLLKIEGIGKLKSNTTAKKVRVEGIFKSKGNITAEEIEIEGIARIFRNIKAKSLAINGVLKMRHANISADKIKCDGVWSCTREVSADYIYVDGVCSIESMYGDTIVINNNDKSGSWNINVNAKLISLIFGFSRLYLGRKISMKHSMIDRLECTNLEASGLKSNVVFAEKVILTNNCIIRKLYCDGDITIDDSCTIGKIISNKETIINKKERTKMADTTLKKVLDLYKDNKINADEAEQMLKSISNYTENDDVKTPWNDDGKLRIVAFLGKKLLKKGVPGSKSFDVTLVGEVDSVECYGNVKCESVKGNVSAGANVECGDIGGNVSCGANVTCHDINGNISAEVVKLKK